MKQSSLFQSLALLHLPFQSCGMLPVSEPSEDSQVQIHLLLSSVHLKLGFLRFNHYLFSTIYHYSSCVLASKILLCFLPFSYMSNLWLKKQKQNKTKTQPCWLYFCCCLTKWWFGEGTILNACSNYHLYLELTSVLLFVIFYLFIFNFPII